MPIKLRQNWALPESAVTPEHIYMTRRQWLLATGFAGAGLAVLFAGGAANSVHERGLAHSEAIAAGITGPLSKSSPVRRQASLEYEAAASSAPAEE